MTPSETAARRVQWRCVICPWVYQDFLGMGIHRVPTSCPDCGFGVRGFPQFQMVTGEWVDSTVANIAEDWKLRGL